MKHELAELPQDFESLLKLAKAWGWEHTRTSNNGHRLISPKGVLVTQSPNPKDFRSIKNFRAELKRAGLPPHYPPKDENPLPPPKMVVSKVEGDSTAPVPPPVNAKPAGRGELQSMVLATLKARDKPEGLSAGEVLPDLLGRFPKLDKNALNTSLSYYFKQKLIDKPAHGRYRIKPEAPQSTAAPSSAPIAVVAEESDAAILEEVLAVLAKLEAVVKRMQAKEKRIAEAMAAVAAIK